ncbi:MAG: hypothetical protein KQH63_18925 [Desulfobulbaceae bacterium]|nr:hypothetical protein [Desulfobulbaceae bacterium]
MKFLEIAVDEVKDKLTESQTKTILDEKLLSIKLRSQIVLPESDKIQNSPLRVATSDRLTEVSNKPVFWLQTGGLLETDGEFSKNFTLAGPPVALGFSAKALVDYQSFRPYILKGKETIADVAKETMVEFPFSAENAQKLLPGTSFQLMGHGDASFSGTFTLQKTLASLSIQTADKIKGEFALRILREEKNKVSVTVSLLKNRSLSTMFKAKVGFEVDTGKISNTIIKHDWYKKAQESVDVLETNKISGLVEGWKEGKKLIDLFDNDKLEKTIGQYLKNYTSFYIALGTETSYELQHLVKYTLDLDQPAGREAYDAICRLNEEKVNKLWQTDKNAIERIEFQSNKTIEQTSLELGFPGKKLIMANTLRAIRDGYLLYDNHMQIMRLETVGKNRKFFNNNEELRWEGLQVQLDNRDTGMDYWRLLYNRNDAFTSRDEVLLFNRFAGMIGIEPYEENKIEDHSFFTKLLSKKDNAKFQADIFITEDGIKKIKNCGSTEIRQIYFAVATELGQVAPGTPIHNKDVRSILREYDPNFLHSDNFEDAQKMESLTKSYHALPVLVGEKRDIGSDARTFHAAEKFRKECIQSLHKYDESEWGGIFADFGAKHSRDFKQVMASLVLLAELDNVLVASIELKRAKSGKILLQAKDSDKIKTGDEIFSEAQEQAMTAM